MQDIERFTKQNIEKVIVPGFEAEPGERAEPLAMGRQTIWGGLGKPPSRDVMQAAAKAARSEMMTRIRDGKAAQPARGGGGGGGNGRGRGPAGGGRSEGSRSEGGGNFGRGPRTPNPGQPRQNTGGQPRQPQQQRVRDDSQPPMNHVPGMPRDDGFNHRGDERNEFDERQPASHASAGFPSSGQPAGGNRGRGNFSGPRSGGGGGGGGGQRRSSGGSGGGQRRSGGGGGGYGNR